MFRSRKNRIQPEKICPECKHPMYYSNLDPAIFRCRNCNHIINTNFTIQKEVSNEEMDRAKEEANNNRKQ